MLDNPGWSVAIELSGTPLEHRQFEEISIERNPTDWVALRKPEHGSVFEAYCGVRNLEECLMHFMNWSELEST